MTVPADVLDAVLGFPQDVQDELVHELGARRRGEAVGEPAWSDEIGNRVDDMGSAARVGVSADVAHSAAWDALVRDTPGPVL